MPISAQVISNHDAFIIGSKELPNPKTVSLISPVIAFPIVQYAEQLGINVKLVLEEKGLGQFYDMLFEKDIQAIPGYSIRVLMEHAISLGQSTFGYDAAIVSGQKLISHSLNIIDSETINLHGLLVAFCQRSMRNNLSTANFLSLEPTEGGIFIKRNQDLVEDLENDSMEQYTLTFLVLLIRYFYSENWHPSIVWLAHSGVNWKSFPIYENTHLFVNKEVGKLFIENEILLKPIDRSKLKRSMSSEPSILSLTTTDSVKQVLSAYDIDNLPDFNKISLLLGFHSKTLRRRLESEGNSFRQIALRMKCQSAEQLMLETDFDITRIAVEVGYKNTTHFCRAMKSLLGKTPYKRLIELRKK